MGIIVEFNPDLALRNLEEFRQGRRKHAECIPAPLEVGKEYLFLKEGQRNYWLHGEIPLLQTEGEGKLSRPLASIVIIEATHFLKNNYVFTKGRYVVKEVFDPADAIVKFEGFARKE